MSGGSSAAERLLGVPGQDPPHPKAAALLLRSDLSPPQRRRPGGGGGGGRRAVPPQEGLDGERPAELRPPPVLASAARRLGPFQGPLGPRGPAPVLRQHPGDQLGEELQEPLEVTPHHLGRDPSRVQLPVVPLTFR